MTDKEPSKTEQELKEKLVGGIPCFRDIFHAMPCPYDGACGSCEDTREAIDNVLAIVKEALPELAKEAGYVKLAKDRTAPLVPDDYEDFAYIYLASQSDMFSAGWRKVDEIPS